MVCVRCVCATAPTVGNFITTVTVPDDIELISSTATFTGPTNEELFSISIVRSHSECLGVTRVIYIHIVQQFPLI